MSGRDPAAAPEGALGLIREHGPIPADLAHELIATRDPDTHPGVAAAIGRMADTLAWRPEAQGFSVAEAGAWRRTAIGREVIACTT